MKRMLMVAALGLVAGGQYALAADLPQAPAPMPRAPATYVPTIAPVYNWSGFYFGINGGYGFGNSTWTDPTFRGPGNTTGSFSTNGFLVGGTVGANFQASIRSGKFQGITWPTTPRGATLRPGAT